MSKSTVTPDKAAWDSFKKGLANKSRTRKRVTDEKKIKADQEKRKAQQRKR